MTTATLRRYIALIGCVLLAACSIAQPRQEVVIYKGCDGKDHATVVDVKVGLPAAECVVMAVQEGHWLTALGFVVAFPALACMAIWPEDADRIRQARMWLYPVNFDALVEHEMEHAKGLEHPFFLPFVHYDKCAA